MNPYSENERVMRRALKIGGVMIPVGIVAGFIPSPIWLDLVVIVVALTAFFVLNRGAKARREASESN